MTRRSRLALVVLAVLVCAPGVGLWWAARSETALAWVAARLEGLAGGRLRIEAPRGSLAGPIGAARIAYADEDVRITVTNVALDYRLGPLLAMRLELSDARADRVLVEVLPSPSTGPPDSLGVPAAIVVERFAIGTLAIDGGGGPVEVRDVAGAYRGGPKGHRIELARAHTPWGDASGLATLGAEKPFGIEGGVHFVRTTPPWRVEATAGLAGTLLSVNVRIDGRVGTAPIEGELGLAPFDERWLTRARAAARDVDLAAFVPGTPKTAATIRLEAASDERGGYAGTISLENASPGTLTADLAPLKAATSAFALDGRLLRLEDLAADLGAAGRARGTGEVELAGGSSRWNLAVEALNLRGLHAPLRQTSLAGKIVARLDEHAQSLDVDVRERGIALVATASREGDRVVVPRLRAAAAGGELTGEATVSLAGARAFEAGAKFRRFDPSQFGDWPAATLNGEFTARGELEPAWHAAVRLRLADSRFRGVPLAANGTFALSPEGVRDADATATVGANRVQAKGGYGRAGDSLLLDLDARNLAQLDPRAAGRLTGRATIGQGRAGHAIGFDVRGERLRWADIRPIATLAATGDLVAGASRTVDLAVTAEGVDALARFEGTWDGARSWRGSLVRFENRGEYAMALVAPASLELAPDRAALGTAAVRGFQSEFLSERLLWERGRLVAAGSLRALPAAALLAAAGWTPERGTDLRLKGEWSIETAPRLNGTARLERESGDVAVAATPVLALGLTRLAVDARFVDDAVTVEGSLAAANLGEASLAARARGLARDAPLAGQLTADVRTLRLLEEVIGTAAVIDGRATAELALGGTLGAPTLAGTAQADAIRIDMPQYGLALRDGRLRAKLSGDELLLEALSIRGPEGELTASGTLARGGEGAALAWRAERLRVFNRPDRRLVVTGSGSVAVSQSKLALRGALRADEGYIEFAGLQPGDRLGEDVVIVGRPPPPRATGPRALPLDLDMTLDPGAGFRIVGQGLDAFLRGKVQVRSRADGEIVAVGAIETARGTFFAFGQRLEIERGRLVFDGPIDNPALDVLALRKNLAVEAGVEVTGTARAPRVQVTSRPPVPESEALSWLVLGRGVPDASSADLALIQAAAAQLGGSGGAAPLQRRITEGLGLDDISIRGAGGGTATGQVVAFGKRVSDRLYVEYEQGISVAANLVRLTYVLTRRLSVNAQTSQTTSSFGFTYRRSFE